MSPSATTIPFHPTWQSLERYKMFAEVVDVFWDSYSKSAIGLVLDMVRMWHTFQSTQARSGDGHLTIYYSFYVMDLKYVHRLTLCPNREGMVHGRRQRSVSADVLWTWADVGPTPVVWLTPRRLLTSPKYQFIIVDQFTS